MTHDEHSFWCGLQSDYVNAQKIAVAVWKDAPAEAQIAAAATIFIAANQRRSGRDHAPARQESAAATPVVACPDCGSSVYDNRADKAAGKLPAKRPDFKCKQCDWVQWPPRTAR